MMSNVMEWLKAASYFGLPHGVWIGLLAFAAVEKWLGGKKEWPRINSVLDAVSAGLGVVLVPVFSRLPIAGPVVLAMLRSFRVLLPEVAPSPAPVPVPPSEAPTPPPVVSGR